MVKAFHKYINNKFIILMPNTLSMALSKNKTQFILSLQRKKTRDEERVFLVEGDKVVREFIQAGREVITLIAKPEFIAGIPSHVSNRIEEVIPVTYEELKKVSSLKTPHNAMAVVRMPEIILNPLKVIENLTVALDFIQDPGNLGTIIRAAAWFGIKDIICSSSCVDVYNTKVVQATMGAIMNVDVHYTVLEEFLGVINKNNIEVYGTLLDGESIYNADLNGKGVILLGNESKGISKELIPFVTKKIMIPKFTDAVAGIDSLNAGMAASIVLSEFARRDH
jgi:RNA methyltransferase, TrmH family